MLHTFHQPVDEPSKRRAHYQAAGDREEEGWRNWYKGEAVRCDRPNGKAENKQCAGIV